MRVWTGVLSLLVAGLLALNASAQEKPAKKGPKKDRPTIKQKFEKLDANRDGTLTEDEFVAGHKKMKEENAKKLFEKLGGTKDKGLSLEEFTKAWKEHVKQYGKKKADKGGDTEKPATEKPATDKPAPEEK